MLKNKKVLLGVTGSIAAYKSVFLVRLLVKAGAEVKVIMTPDAAAFVTPLTFSTLSKNEVATHIATNEQWVNHVSLGRWANVFLIAPATCNTIAKLAGGICDNLLTAVYLSAVCPVMIAPAMDEDMWKHPSTGKNLSALKDYGNEIIEVREGELASGLVGPGRMEEPEVILERLVEFFNRKTSLKNRRALVTAGPTFEAIDPVRFIGNHSSGKMGMALACALASRGAAVTLVLGPTQLDPPKGVQVVNVVSAAEMYDAVMGNFDRYDIIIMAAAVADFTPASVHPEKIKKQDATPEIRLVKTKDILAEAGKRKSDHQLLTGFALETSSEKENAWKKLIEKNADFIVLNSLKDEGAGYGKDTNKITIFEKNGREHVFPVKSKAEVANDIINVITNLYE